MRRARSPFLLPSALAALMLAGCATRSMDVVPITADPAEFAHWPCARLEEELDAVQKKAADVAYAVDQRAGSNIAALGVGLMVFWPALVALRPEGLEATDLARLKGRYEALRVAGERAQCAPPGNELPPERQAALPVATGDRLVYEDRVGGRRNARVAEWPLVLTALRRGEFEYRVGTAGEPLRHDNAGNVLSAPNGALMWPYLLRHELALGQVTAGDIVVVGDPLARARMRGQVVAIGPQHIAGRQFDAAVIELYGDAQRGEAYTRVDGALVIDRRSGVLLRLDLRSAQPQFALQRRLARVERVDGAAARPAAAP